MFSILLDGYVAPATRPARVPKVKKPTIPVVRPSEVPYRVPTPAATACTILEGVPDSAPTAPATARGTYDATAEGIAILRSIGADHVVGAMMNGGRSTDLLTVARKAAGINNNGSKR